MTSPFEELGFDPEILGPQECQQASVRDRLLSTARKAARQVPFMPDVVAGYYCAIDPATPAKVRAAILAALAYFVLPLDMVPDFLLGIGYGDDATILMGVLALIRNHIRAEHMDAATRALSDGDL